MKAKKSQTAGFTVMELMVGIITMSIMVLAVGSMLYFGFLGWKRQNNVVNMQRDASLALRVMAKEIRMSNSAGINTSVASVLTCNSADGTRSTTFALSDSNLDATGTVSMRLLRNCVNSFTVSQSTTNGVEFVEITLNLDSGTDQNINTVTIATRN